MLTKYVGQRREKYGRAGVLAVVGGALLLLLNSWQSLEFLVGKREGFAVVAGAVLDFVLSPGFGVALVAAGAAGVVGLHFYDKSRREQGATSLPTNAPRAEKSPPRVTATQTIRTEVDEDGTEHTHVSVTPAPIQIGTRFPSDSLRDNGSILFQAPDNADLEVVMEREEFHPFQHMAVLLEAKIRIRNKTTKTKYINHMRWEIDPAVDGQDARWGTDTEVHRALFSLKEKRNELPGHVGPLDTIAGWVHVSLPHQPRGGIGGYTTIVEDEVGAGYVLRRETRRTGTMTPSTPKRLAVRISSA